MVVLFYFKQSEIANGGGGYFEPKTGYEALCFAYELQKDREEMEKNIIENLVDADFHQEYFVEEENKVYLLDEWIYKEEQLIYKLNERS